MFFLDFFYGGIVSYFSAETTVGANVGGSKNRMESPNTRVTNKSRGQERTCHEKRGDKESPKACAHLKSCESLYTCPRTPFIGRRRDFYILILPSHLGNISNVNTYKNVFYTTWFAGLISYIYKPVTSSHFKPGLLKRRLWLGLFLTPEALIHENHRSLWLLNWDSTRLPNFADSWFPELRQFPIILKWSSWNGQ
jgi:hypothetical protein